jgi:rod shape determining protein RodA
MQKINRIFNFNDISKLFLLLVIILCVLGLTMQYSAGNGVFNKYAYSYLVKAIIGFIILFIAFKIDIKIIFLLTTPLYVASVVLLMIVDLIGITKLGAQRWIGIGPIAIQPSELMKIALILMLAKHFHNFSLSKSTKLKFYLEPILLTLLPFFLVSAQPDLGTAIILLGIACGVFFIAGFKIRYFVSIFLSIVALFPIFWLFLYDYQKNRILTFLDPAKDSLGAGYHIMQSKIAIGSGGLFGKNFLQGSQSQLDFLPEKHTDFIFTLLAEELGFIGVLLLLILYGGIITLKMIIAKQCNYSYGKFVIIGIGTMFFIHIFVNIGMVSGLLPVVGVPLPLVSFGGTSMVTNMIGFGLLLNIENNKHYS